MSVAVSPSASTADSAPRLDNIARALLLVLAVAALGLIAGRFRLAMSNAPLDYNEGWNAYHALRLVQTGSPYPPAGSLVTNNYPPLWFGLVALAGHVTPTLVAAGRLVASLGFLLLLASATAIGFSLHGRAGALATFASVAYVLATQANEWIGVADPQLLAQGVGVLALLLAVRARGTDTPLYALAIVIAVLAGFLKHNLAALPAALLLASLRDGRRSVLRAAVSAIVAILAGYLVCAAIGGADWPSQLVSPRQYFYGRLVNSTIPFVTLNGLGLLLGLAGLRTLPAGFVRRVLMGYLFIAFPLAVFFSGGAGVVVNIFFDTLIATAIAASLLVGHRDFLQVPAELGNPNAVPVVAPWMLTGAISAWLVFGGLYTMRDLLHEFRHNPLQERVARYEADIQYLRSIPGNAICDQPALCYLADKPFVYDPYNAGQLLLTGTIQPDSMRTLLRGLDVRVIHAGPPPADTAGIPVLMRAEVRAEFRAERSNREGTFLVRRSPAAPMTVRP